MNVVPDVQLTDGVPVQEVPTQYWVGDEQLVVVNGVGLFAAQSINAEQSSAHCGPLFVQVRALEEIETCVPSE